MTSKQRVVKTFYYGNWADIWAFPLAERLLPFALRIPGITPNKVTLVGFAAYTIGSILLFMTNVPNHLLWAAFLIPFGFVMDDLDGQVARETNLYSELGNYLDKVLDVLKMFIVTASLSYAVYLNTQNILHIYLGFIATAFFYIRYYIKLESVLRQIEIDKEYLEKSGIVMKNRESELIMRHTIMEKTTRGKLRAFWEKNRTIFLVDEAEFAVFTGIGAYFNKLEAVLWILAVSQVTIFVWRFYERGQQLIHKRPTRYLFMRK